MDYETGDLTTRSRIDFSGSPEAMRMYDMLEQQYRNKRKKLAEKGNLIPRGNYVVTYEW